LRVLARASEEIGVQVKLLILRAKRRIGVRRRLVTLVQLIQVRFPCATATTSPLKLLLVSSVRDPSLPALAPANSRDSLKQLDGLVQGRRGQMHVPLRRAQAHVAGQLLDCLRRRPAHREARAEGVPQDVQPARHLKPCPAFSAASFSGKAGSRSASGIVISNGISLCFRDIVKTSSPTRRPR
jgi:hypothetical protein